MVMVIPVLNGYVGINRGVSRTSCHKEVKKNNMSNVSAKAKLNVLIVDDDVVLCELLSEHLKSEYQVQCAHTCEEALMRMSARQADVVVLDYDLPDGKGLSIVSKLRSCNPRLRTIDIDERRLGSRKARFAFPITRGARRAVQAVYRRATSLCGEKLAGDLSVIGAGNRSIFPRLSSPA